MGSRFLVPAMMMMAGSAPGVLAQPLVPTTAQVWDVRFVVDEDGPLAAGPSATQVGITLWARVGILPNSTSFGTTNFGVSRVGGAGTATSGARIMFTDQVSRDLGWNEGSVAPGRTGDARRLSASGAVDPAGVLTDLRDTSGELLVGHFAPFRGSFLPQTAPLFLGSNSVPGNGVVINPLTGSPILTNLIGSRQFNFMSEGSGPLGAASAPDADPAHLVGDLTPIYRMIFTPSPGGPRAVSLSYSGITARYIVHLSGIPESLTLICPIAPGETTFLVPAPGAWGLAMLALAAASRRRRG